MSKIKKTIDEQFEDLIQSLGMTKKANQILVGHRKRHSKKKAKKQQTKQKQQRQQTMY